ncbi:hypothetical protein CVM50_17135 [Pseudooceanicola marinus]|nr:hypothetical protein CVM50_17135 [Pseudooceanicola marinus]
MAQARPIGEIADRLGVADLKRVTHSERAGPCPACGGRDRFALNTARGVFNCRGCGARGDGIALVRLVLGCDFPSALAFLEGERVEVDPAEIERRRRAAADRKRAQEEEAARYRAHAIGDARKIWQRSSPADGSPVMQYLAARSIRLPRAPDALRFLPDHPCVKKIGGRLETLHRGPCMIAGILDRSDRLVAVHQTWLDLSRPDLDFKAEIRSPSGERLPAKMVRGAKKGGAIRLGATGSSARALVAGEGIETTLSAMVVDPIGPANFWALVDLGNMSGIMLDRPGVRWSGEPDMSDSDAWVPPPWVDRLFFLRDGDSAPAMTSAKLRAGIERARASVPGLVGRIVDPGEGRDFNDILRGK